MQPKLTTFLDMIVLAEAADFTSLPMKKGDVVYFGAHDILSMPDEPIKRSDLTPKLGVIQSVSKSAVVVSPPEKHSFRMKLPIKKGQIFCDPSHLHKIEDENIADEMDMNKESGEKRKLYIYTPNGYTSTKLRKKSDRIKKMSADSQQAPTDPSGPVSLQDIGWPGSSRELATINPDAKMMTRNDLMNRGQDDPVMDNPYRPNIPRLRLQPRPEEDNGYQYY